MIEFIFYSALIYACIAIPYKLWIATGKYDYLKRDTDIRIEDLEFNNKYYIDQINDLRRQLSTVEQSRDVYHKLWNESIDKLIEIEDAVGDMPDGESKTILEDIIYRDDEIDENNDI